jgi:hypothetical protein
MRHLRIDKGLVNSLRLVVALFLLPNLGGGMYHKLMHGGGNANHTCSSNRRRCSNGSFNSVYALQNSFPHMNPSKRSQSPGRERCHLASGDITCGWPTVCVVRNGVDINGERMTNAPMKDGEMHRGSMNSPTSCKRSCVRYKASAMCIDERTLSSRRAFVRGSLHSTLCYQQQRSVSDRAM